MPGRSVLLQTKAPLSLLATSVSWLTNSPGPTSSPIFGFLLCQKNLWEPRDSHKLNTHQVKPNKKVFLCFFLMGPFPAVTWLYFIFDWPFCPCHMILLYLWLALLLWISSVRNSHFSFWLAFVTTWLLPQLLLERFLFIFLIGNCDLAFSPSPSREAFVYLFDGKVWSDAHAHNDFIPYLSFRYD